MDELEEQRRLEAEIAAAAARATSARERIDRSHLDTHVTWADELRSLSLEEMERRHAADVAKIRDLARAETRRILAEAREQIAGGARDAMGMHR